MIYDECKISILSARCMIDDAIEAGEKKGKMEGKIEVARNLLKKGMSMEDVCDATGLSRQQIEALLLT